MGHGEKAICNRRELPAPTAKQPNHPLEQTSEGSSTRYTEPSANHKVIDSDMNFYYMAYTLCSWHQ